MSSLLPEGKLPRLQDEVQTPWGSQGLYDWPLPRAQSYFQSLALSSSHPHIPNSLEFPEYIHQSSTYVFTHTAPSACNTSCGLCLNNSYASFKAHLGGHVLSQVLSDTKSSWDDLLFPHGTQIPCLS